MAKSQTPRRSRRLCEAADEQLAVESSSSSSAVPDRRKRQAPQEMADDFHEEVAETAGGGGMSSSRRKKKALAVKESRISKHADNVTQAEEDDQEEEDEDTVTEEVAANSSKKKKKCASSKPPSKPTHEDDTVCSFLGDPIDLDEAKRRWPERYTKKIKGRNKASFLVQGNGDEDEDFKAKCHYQQAKIDGVIYNLFDDAHVKAVEGELNYIGRIIEFFESQDGKLYFTAQWYYRAENTVMTHHAKDHDQRRIFLSQDKNVNDLDCIVSKIKIIRVSANTDLAVKEKGISKCDYYYDMSYSTAYSTFANLGREDIKAGSSSSTISCEDTCDNGALPLKASLLDLYSGCGAMSTGLCHGANLAGSSLYTAWAVDCNSFACQCLQMNHPKAKVRNEKAEDFLYLLREWKKFCEKFSLDVKHPPKPKEEDFVDEDDDVDSSPVPRGEFEVDRFIDICYGDPNEIGKKELMFKVRWKGYGPSDDTWEPISGLSKCTERIENFVRNGYKNQILPLPGNIDVICGGPPCQGISGFNRFRDSSNPLADPRNQQMAVFMEIVDFLKPKFVLMENVVDILKFAEGFLGRFALSKLVKMNYQARLGIMAAGCFGLPQFRMRVFLWGAQRTEVLPQFPLPTHDVVVRGGAPVKFEENIVAYSENHNVELQKALLLGDAIADLPEVGNYEGRDEMPYTEPPKTDFQYSIRLKEKDWMCSSCDPKKIVLHDALFDHRPLQLNEDDYLRVCRVPKKKGANFRDFPGVVVGPNNVVEFDSAVERVLLPSGSPLVPDYAMSYIKGRSPKPFGRLWWDETVPTVVTRAEPHNQIIVHPVQDRVLTVRENARIQGFPDYYKLCGPIKERYIQVGNAVAMPVSRALGFSLGRAFQGNVGDEPHFTLPKNFPHFGIMAGEEATN